MKPRVVIADEQQMMVEGLAVLLSAEFEVAGTASNGHTLVQLAEQHSPGAAITEITLPLMNGIDAAHGIRQTSPKTKIVILTGQMQ